MARTIVPIGPQHPLLKEPIAFQIVVEGEQVTGCGVPAGP